MAKEESKVHLYMPLMPNPQQPCESARIGSASAVEKHTGWDFTEKGRVSFPGDADAQIPRRRIRGNATRAFRARKISPPQRQRADLGRRYSRQGWPTGK